MAVVNTTLCLPFRQAEQTITVWTQTVLEACKRTCFPYEEEASDVLARIAESLVSLLHAKLIDAISVDFGLTSVQFTLRYDAEPEEEDELDIELLDLVLEPPGSCVITLTLTDWEKAAFFCCPDLESASTAHVSVVLAALPVPDDAEEGEY
jgi:hypothetical protein